MGEATRDKRKSTSESAGDLRKDKGWIRIHTDEAMKSPPVEEPLDTEAQPPERKVRKESEKREKESGKLYSE